jgi:hypothetical protein
MTLTFSHRDEYGWTWDWSTYSYHSLIERHLDWHAANRELYTDISYEGDYYRSDRFWIKGDLRQCVDNFIQHCWPRYDSYAGKALFYHCSGFICYECGLKEFERLLADKLEPEIHTGPGEINEGWTPPTTITLETGDDDYHLPGILWDQDFDGRESEQICDICNEVIVEQMTYIDYHTLPYEFGDLPIFRSDNWHVMTGEEMVKVLREGKAQKIGKQTYTYDHREWTVDTNKPEEART